MSKDTMLRQYNYVQAQLAQTQALLADAPSKGWAFSHAKAYQLLLRELFTLQRDLYHVLDKKTFFAARDKLVLLPKETIQAVLKRGRV